MNGTPQMPMSAWPLTSTSCCWCTLDRVSGCTWLGAPALIPVTPYGAYDDCQILRRSLVGSTSLARLAARYDAWSRRFHSHSRLFRKPIADGNGWLFTVVSMVNTLTCPPSRSVIRSYEWCIAEFGGSLNDRECIRVFELWWWRSEL